jgi:iron complex transport system substrate-binding protein
VSFVVLVLALLLPFSCKSAIAGDAPTTRIVSLMPNMTEVLFAIGADAQVVGDSDYCNWPDAAKAKPRVGGLLNPNLEKVLLLKPTHTILHNSQADFAAKLQRAGITPLVMKHDTMDDLHGAIRQAGALTGMAAQADALSARIRAEIADAARSVPARARRPRVLLVMAREGGELRGIYAGGPATHLGEILGEVGGENAVKDSAHPSLPVSIEQLMAMNPDIIIDFSTGESAESGDGQATRNVWARLPLLKAVKDGRVHSLADPHLAIPGPAAGRTAREFARILRDDDTTATGAMAR